MSKPESVRKGAAEDPAAIFAFDLLSLDGDDYRNYPLVIRKAMLRPFGTPFSFGPREKTVAGVCHCVDRSRIVRSRVLRYALSAFLRNFNAALSFL